MNKRIISALVLAGMIASTSAFASRARELVLGQGGANVAGSSRGSFYYDDAYNFFYNPAYVNDFKNWVIVEKDAQNAASFGFVSSMSNFNLGLFFNREGAAINPQADHAVDLFIGGDTGLKWGLGVNYSGKSATAQTLGYNKANEMNARFGISMNGLDPYVSYRFLGKNEIGGVETAKYKGYGAGLRYHYGEWTPYAAYNKNKEDHTDTSSKAFVVGLGRETKLAEGARLVYSLFYQNTKTSTGAVDGPKVDALPIQMGVEADALSWLTLRAGVNHTILTSRAQDKNTTARIGGTFHVSKVDVDYAFGNGNTIGTVTPDSSNIGFDSGTFHEVAMRYSW